MYGSTAGLPTYSSRVDLGTIAEAAGWTVSRTDDPENLRSEFNRLVATTGPTLLQLSIEPGNGADIPKLLIDPVVWAYRFQAWLPARLAGSSATS